MKINLTSIIVEDQEHALRFYTQMLGFLPKLDMMAGDYRFVTVVSPEAPDGTQLSLDAALTPAVRAYQAYLYENGMVATAFAVDDVQAEYERLSQLGVEFTHPPLDLGPVTAATFKDTCGNLIQIARFNA